MIYFTKDALRIIKQKFFYLELADGSKAIVYKQDKGKAQEALKKEKYKLKFSFYSMLDENNVENDVYLLGVGNKQTLMNKMLKILIAGPAVNFVTAGLVFYWTQEFAIINFLIGIFNLLPIFELDGMRIISILIK